MKKIILCSTILIFTIVGCDSSNKNYEIGICLIPNKSNDVTSIVKIVGYSGNVYKVFTHFLSDGRLILSEDYTNKNKSDINKGYSIVQCPNVDGTFSPDKYLNKK